jgi:hypothetical protein
MAGFFTSQCFHQGLSKAMIKKGDIIIIKPQCQNAGDASFTGVARNDEENGRVDISAVELAHMDVWPTQTDRTDMIKATGRRIEQQARAPQTAPGSLSRSPSCRRRTTTKSGDTIVQIKLMLQS